MERRVLSAGQCHYFSSIGQECQISQAAALLRASTALPLILVAFNLFPPQPPFPRTDTGAATSAHLLLLLRGTPSALPAAAPASPPLSTLLTCWRLSVRIFSLLFLKNAEIHEKKEAPHRFYTFLFPHADLSVNSPAAPRQRHFLRPPQSSSLIFFSLEHKNSTSTSRARNEKFVNGRENLCSLLKLNYTMTSPRYATNLEGDEINFPPMSAQTREESDQWQTGMQIRNLSRQELNVN